MDGHSTDDLYTAFSWAKEAKEQPRAVIARTVKGRGVPDLEAAPLSHVMAITPEVIDSLLDETS